MFLDATTAPNKYIRLRRAFFETDGFAVITDCNLSVVATLPPTHLWVWVAGVVRKVSPPPGIEYASDQDESDSYRLD